MEFLVEIDVNWPVDGDPIQKAELIAAEGKRAKELSENGLIRRIWRIPGRRSNISLWEASDASELHAALASLPFFPWLDIKVRPLANHPNDPAK